MLPASQLLEVGIRYKSETITVDGLSYTNSRLLALPFPPALIIHPVTNAIYSDLIISQDENTITISKAALKLYNSVLTVDSFVIGLIYYLESKLKDVNVIDGESNLLKVDCKRVGEFFDNGLIQLVYEITAKKQLTTTTDNGYLDDEIDVNQLFILPSDL